MARLWQSPNKTKNCSCKLTRAGGVMKADDDVQIIPPAVSVLDPPFGRSLGGWNACGTLQDNIMLNNTLSQLCSGGWNSAGHVFLHVPQHAAGVQKPCFRPGQPGRSLRCCRLSTLVRRRRCRWPAAAARVRLGRAVPREGVPSRAPVQTYMSSMARVFYNLRG